MAEILTGIGGYSYQFLIYYFLFVIFYLFIY